MRLDTAIYRRVPNADDVSARTDTLWAGTLDFVPVAGQIFSIPASGAEPRGGPALVRVLDVIVYLTRSGNEAVSYAYSQRVRVE